MIDHERRIRIAIMAMITLLVLFIAPFALAEHRDGYIRGGFLGNQFMCGHHGRMHTYPVYAEYGCYESGSGRGQQFNRNQIGGRSRRSSYSFNITSSKVVGVAQVGEGVAETIFGYKDNNKERDHEYRLARLERGLPEGQGLVPVISVPSQTEQKIARNLFNRATITIYTGSAVVEELGASVEQNVQIPAGAQIWAEAKLFHGGKLYREKLTVGNGIRPLPQNAGWEFYNPTAEKGVN